MDRYIKFSLVAFLAVIGLSAFASDIFDKKNEVPNFVITVLFLILINGLIALAVKALRSILS